MFTAWLLDQQDRSDATGRIARAIFEDHNAGCAVMYADPIGWMKHFQEKHRKTLPTLSTLLGEAYVEYVNSLAYENTDF
jgi:hypothetical protein